MLDSNMDALGDDPLPDLLVDDDSDGSGVDIEDGAGAAVIVLVRHALVDGSIDDDVNDVSDLEAGQRVGDVDGSVLFESFSEFVSGGDGPVCFFSLSAAGGSVFDFWKAGLGPGQGGRQADVP